MMPLLILLELRLECEVSPSEIHPCPPFGLSLKFINVGVDMELEGYNSKSWDEATLSEKLPWFLFIIMFICAS